MAKITPKKPESAVMRLLVRRMASPTQLAAARKRDRDHEITKAHLAHLHATEAQARKEGGNSWAIHDLMMEEVEKFIYAYDKDENRAWYEINKISLARLLHKKQVYCNSGHENWSNWRYHVNATQQQMQRYEERYGDQQEEWGWNAES